MNAKHKLKFDATYFYIKTGIYCFGIWEGGGHGTKVAAAKEVNIYTYSPKRQYLVKGK